MDIEEAKKILKCCMNDDCTKCEYADVFDCVKEHNEAIETVLEELENSISISKVEEAIEELNQEIENCERRQNEVIALGGDDLHIREEIWDLEDKIHLLKQTLEGVAVLQELLREE